MTTKLRSAALLTLAGALALAGSQVWAGGIPASDTLHYSGTLEDSAGVPITGDRFIEVQLWHDASSVAEPPDCATGSQKQTLERGHFSVPLPSACRDAIGNHPDMFVEVLVDRASLGRVKLGAVPYAIEADHATNSESAKTADSAAGDLKVVLEEAEARLAALEKATTPKGLIERFNAATSDGASVQLGPIDWQVPYNIGWALQHAAAAAGCAATSPIGDSPAAQRVLTKPSGMTCADACASNGAPYVACRNSIAIGGVLQTRATAYTDVVANNYNYGCADNQRRYDEVAGESFPDPYAAYCCCYVPR